VAGSDVRLQAGDERARGLEGVRRTADLGDNRVHKRGQLRKLLLVALHVQVAHFRKMAPKRKAKVALVR